MGNNYYIEEPPCAACGRRGEALHIGKSSAGWCFTMRIHPDKGITCLEDWKAYWQWKRIVDEYGREVTPDKMLEIITERDWPHKNYSLDYLNSNGAEIGPNNLFRHKIGDFCVGHGTGTWDYVIREFS